MKDFWENRYKEKVYAYGIEPNAYFREKLTAQSPGKLLLIGEGEGRNAVFAAGLGWEVTAVDYSEAAREKALRLADSRSVNIEYIVSDVLDFDPGSAAFDAVGLIFAHFPPDTRHDIHRRLVKALKPQGILILEAFHKDQLGKRSGGPKNLDMLYSMEEVLHDFQGMTISMCQREEIQLEEGPYHRGSPVVVRLMAERTK